MKFPIKKSRSFFRKIGSCASYASYACCASENRRMFGIKTMGINSFHRLRLLLPPPTGRSPSLDEGGLGLRASSQSLVCNPGCRVATLLVSKGVMGFLGDLREDRSRARPVGDSARRSIPSEREQTLLRPLSAVNRNLPLIP